VTPAGARVSWSVRFCARRTVRNLERVPDLTRRSLCKGRSVTRGRPSRRQAAKRCGSIGSYEFRRDATGLCASSTTRSKVRCFPEGDRSVSLTIDGAVKLLRPDASAVRIEGNQITVALEPGASCEFRLEDARILADWATQRQGRDSGTAAIPEAAELICSDPYDEGIIDRWRLETFSYPVQPKSGDVAAWLLRPPLSDPPVIMSHVGPTRREYYVSKQDDRRLGNGSDLKPVNP
jgi:hypothetical protein